MRRFTAALSSVALIAAAPVSPAWADNYPSKPIRLIVPAGAGSIVRVDITPSNFGRIGKLGDEDDMRRGARLGAVRARLLRRRRMRLVGLGRRSRSGWI